MIEPVKRDPIHPGQESVWDYPRPPRVEHTGEHITIELDGVTVADTRDVVRVLETSHPPVYYLPRGAFTPGVLQPDAGHSYCEFKGAAGYLSVGSRARSAWFYPTPNAGFESITDRVAVYPGSMDRCTVDGETVRAQDGDFYGGWITEKIVGPFKGAAGTTGW
ncbi:DUF427 domain-containing protein [Cryobacterium serini]|uniref:DUF427 domain-containing protein n=1 Tax=Cryobacterium serini TaxID=1259201 RepID=A0A4R9BJS0_9MICO|nr:DUF427 domain-containing protein [Cryobacterium serini]TFD84951.1 DUF427 domain-containing protein [Cryobacterium serini]